MTRIYSFNHIDGSCFLYVRNGICAYALEMDQFGLMNWDMNRRPLCEEQGDHDPVHAMEVVTKMERSYHGPHSWLFHEVRGIIEKA